MKRLKIIIIILSISTLTLNIFSKPKSNNRKIMYKILFKFNYNTFNYYSFKTKYLKDIIKQSIKPSPEANVITFLIEYSIYIKRMREIALTGIDPMDYSDKHRRVKNNMNKIFDDSIKLKDRIKVSTDIKFIFILPPLKF